jgi:hypothetical protein
MKISFASPPKMLDEKMVYNILRDYKMLNCEVLVRDENGTALNFGQAPLLIKNSNSGRLNRCDYEGSSNIHSMVSNSDNCWL